MSALVLRGTEVDIRQDGVLLVKTRFGIQKRPRYVSLSGVRLTVNESHLVGETTQRVFDITKAKVQSHHQHLRMHIFLSTKEKLTFYAENEREFDRWLKAFSDAIEWTVQRFYDLQEELGAGAFSKVRKAFHRQSGNPVAVKVIDKGVCSLEDMKYFKREIDIARSLQHENVTRTLDCFESEKNLYIVVEFMEGGNLSDFVQQFGKLSETSSKIVMKHIFKGLDYIHSKGVVHRDIKPDNLLCSRRTLPTSVKLTDFGLSRRTEGFKESGAEVEDEALGPEGLMTTPVGTPNFVAPEVLHGLPYGKEVDMFSCGVVMYYLLAGVYPFEDPDPQKLIERIKTSDYHFPEEQWLLISEEAKDLVAGLLDRSPFTRVSAAAALSHPWLVGRLRTSSCSETDQPMSKYRRPKQGRETRYSEIHLEGSSARAASYALQGDLVQRKSRIPERKTSGNSPISAQEYSTFVENEHLTQSSTIPRTLN